MNLKDKTLYDVNRTSKVCTKCGVDKPLGEFVKQKDSFDGLNWNCKDCVKKYHKEWYRENKERQKKNAKRYRKENPDANYTHHIKNTYGISKKYYNKMFKDQKGACAICGTHQSELTKRLFVDHCHKEGEVRGLLCHRCNSAIGLLRDDASLIKKAAEYVAGFERFE